MEPATEVPSTERGGNVLPVITQLPQASRGRRPRTSAETPRRPAAPSPPPPERARTAKAVRPRGGPTRPRASGRALAPRRVPTAARPKPLNGSRAKYVFTSLIPTFKYSHLDLSLPNIIYLQTRKKISFLNIEAHPTFPRMNRKEEEKGNRKGLRDVT